MPRLDADEAASPDEVVVAAAPAVQATETTALPHGDALTLDEASTLTTSRRQRLIVILGERRAGKTTLLAEMHQAFLRGPFGGYFFAGSETLVAFEKRCALGRTASRQEKASMRRTPFKDGIRLLHLIVRPETLVEGVRELLLTDVSGELSKAARRSEADAQELAPIVGRADRIVVVIDGAKLANPMMRQRTRADTKTLLRALVQAGGVRSGSRVDIVLNKWDRVLAEPAAPTFAEAFLEEAASAIRADVSLVEVHRVAARVRGRSQISPWHGMAKLLSGWAENHGPRRQAEDPPRRTSSRAFLNYGVKATE